MSQIKVTNINNASAASGGIAFDADGHVTVDGLQLPTAGALSNRNKIINGAMVHDQRNAGSSVTPADGDYTLDRWSVGLTQSSKFSVQQSTVAPTGFSNSLLVTSLSAYSVVAGDLFRVSQLIEGFNFSDSAWGTASAKTVTLSFWVRSSLTGTFGGSFVNSANNRSYPFSYAISSADTWEQKSVVIAGDTTGTWVGATNGIGVRVHFSLGAGSTFSGTAGSWAGSLFTSATGATSVVGTSGATLYLTGVQLEVGAKATPFEHRSYGDELARCQRYFVREQNNASHFVNSGIAGGGVANHYFYFPVEMRATPTGSSTGTFQFYDGAWKNGVGSGNQVSALGNKYGSVGVQYSTTANFMPTDSTIVSFLLNLNGGSFSFSAEL